MTLNDKVQVGDTTTSTSTSTTTSQWQTYKAEQGWECPRCGRINAPWVRQCDCSKTNWTITTSDWTYTPDWTYRPEWWKEVTCHDDNVMNNPVTYEIEQITSDSVGGSDYWNPHTKTYENVSTHVHNKIDPNSVTTAWNTTNLNNCHTPHYTTETVGKL